MTAATLRDVLTADTLARRFHEVYEKLAPNFGYETRPESAKPWEAVPANNRALMVATADVLLDEMGLAREVLIKQVCRTGVHTIEREGDRYFLTLKNRTYSSEHEVPVETARRYWRKMKEDERSGVARDISVTSG